MTRALALVVSLFMAMALAVPAQAQDTLSDADYTSWQALATSVEKSVSDATADDKTLNSERQQIVAWRDRLQAGTNANAARIASLRDQISALGPPPAEGQSEAEDVAARRKELGAQLSQLQAPGLKAVEAVSRANSLIQSIDGLLRDRQASALMHLSPSPLLPTSWAAAAREVSAMVVGLAAEPVKQAGAINRDSWRGSLPLLGGYLLVAALLLIQGRRWVGSLPSRLSASASEYSRDVVIFISSLGQIVIPSIGVLLAVMAADESGLFAAWWMPILLALPHAGATFFTGLWLARRFLPIRLPGPIEMPDPPRARARAYASGLAVVMALHILFSRVVQSLSGRVVGADEQVFPLRFSEEAAGVLHLPLIVLGAFFLFKLGSILRRAQHYDGSDQPAYRVHITAALGVVLRPLAIAIVIAALIGYVSLANGVLWPMIRTIALLALLILLQEFIADLYGMALRNQDQGRDALLPVLIGFVLVIASLPVFALIWGARVSDLAEAWTRLKHGVAIGGIQLSPGAVLTFLVVFGICYAVTRLVQGAFRSSILPKTRIDAGGQNAIVSGLGYVGIILAIMLAISAAGINLASLAIVAGALSVGIGFGMQNIVSNFVSGIILLIERPISVGDWINVKGAEGYVRRISVRSTQIQTFDRSDVIVPNSDLISNPVTNWTRGSPQGRIIIPVSVGYDSDTRQVAEILTRIAEDQPTVLINPAPFVLFKDFGADGLMMELRCVLADINQGVGVQNEIRHQIMEQFRAAGIEIPFAQRDINIRAAHGLTDIVDAAVAGRAKAASAAAGPEAAAPPIGPAPHAPAPENAQTEAPAPAAAPASPEPIHTPTHATPAKVPSAMEQAGFEPGADDDNGDSRDA